MVLLEVNTDFVSLYLVPYIIGYLEKLAKDNVIWKQIQTKLEANNDVYVNCKWVK